MDAWRYVLYRSLSALCCDTYVLRDPISGFSSTSSSHPCSQSRQRQSHPHRHVSCQRGVSVQRLA
eukprot:4881007-Pyramimonas_sp.AAC.2